MTTTKKNSRKARWLWYGLSALLILGGTGWGTSMWWLWASAAPLDSPVGNTTKVRFTIPEGMPLQTIGEELQQAGVIRSSFALRIWLQWGALRPNGFKSLQAGTYEFAMSQPLAEVVGLMQSGKPLESKFTIREGWSIAQIAQYFEQQGFFAATDFVAASKLALTSSAIQKNHPWLPQNNPNLEGYLFPDTYQLPPQEVTPERVIEIMLNRFEEVALPEYQAYSQAYDAVIPAQIPVQTVQINRNKSRKSSKIEARPSPKLSLPEWVTLASMVEKESVLDSERPLIAGVFHNRLQLGMRLESDPTVEYAFNIKQTPEQPLTLKQVATPSPYNTYMNIGLPPGAIAAPGLASLKATLAPAKTKDLFFVALYDGSHIFSPTYEQHKAAIRQVAQKFKR